MKRNFGESATTSGGVLRRIFGRQTNARRTIRRAFIGSLSVLPAATKGGGFAPAISTTTIISTIVSAEVSTAAGLIDRHFLAFSALRFIFVSAEVLVSYVLVTLINTSKRNVCHNVALISRGTYSLSVVDTIISEKNVEKRRRESI